MNNDVNPNSSQGKHDIALYSKSKCVAGRSKKLRKYTTVKCIKQTLFTHYRNIILLLEQMILF